MTPATKTILICDDDQGMRDTIAAILGRDYRVLTVSSGEAGLALLRQEDVDGRVEAFGMANRERHGTLLRGQDPHRPHEAGKVDQLYAERDLRLCGRRVVL